MGYPSLRSIHSQRRREKICHYSWEYALVFLQPLGKSVGNSIQFEVVFQQCFQARKHPSKSALRIKRIFYHLISITLESRICNRDVGCVVLERSEDPLNGRHRTIVAPLEHYPFIWFQFLDLYLDGHVIHFPRPDNVFARFQAPGTFGEPKLASNFRIDKGFKDLRHWFADEHLGFGNGCLCQLKVSHGSSDPFVMFSNRG